MYNNLQYGKEGKRLMSYLPFNLFKGLHIKTYFKYVKTIVKQISLFKKQVFLKIYFHCELIN